MEPHSLRHAYIHMHACKTHICTTDLSPFIIDSWTVAWLGLCLKYFPSTTNALAWCVLYYTNMPYLHGYQRVLIKIKHSGWCQRVCRQWHFSRNKIKTQSKHIFNSWWGFRHWPLSNRKSGPFFGLTKRANQESKKFPLGLEKPVTESSANVENIFWLCF